MTFYWRPVAAVNVTQIMQFFRHNFNSFLVMMVMNRLCLSHIYILCHIHMFFSRHSYLAQRLCIRRMRLLNFKGVWVLSKVSRWVMPFFFGYIKRFVLGKDCLQLNLAFRKRYFSPSHSNPSLLSLFHSEFLVLFFGGFLKMQCKTLTKNGLT